MLGTLNKNQLSSSQSNTPSNLRVKEVFMTEEELLEDKFIGTFIGLSLGDALGAPYEGGLIEQILWKFFSKTPTGEMRWTDDTQMSIDVAENIIEHKNINENTLAEKFAANYKWSRGYGPAASKVLKSISKGTKWEIASRLIYKDGSLGNGGAMRSQVIALRYFDNDDLLIQEISKATKITHAHPLAIEGAVLIGKTVSLALKDINPIEINKLIIENSMHMIFREKANLSLKWLEERLNISPKEVSKNLGNGMRATDSCITAIYLALRFQSKSFLEMIDFTKKCGGDVDTLCSMSGSIWGAFNGLKNIPKDLICNLEQADKIKSLASNLYKAKVHKEYKVD